MELLANDLSVHEQFHNLTAFRDALSRLMIMRVVAKRFGRKVHCNRTLLVSTPIRCVSMQQAIGSLAAESERRAAMIWLTQAGPFWDDVRRHGGDDWLECGGGRGRVQIVARCGQRTGRLFAFQLELRTGRRDLVPRGS